MRSLRRSSLLLRVKQSSVHKNQAQSMDQDTFFSQSVRPALEPVAAAKPTGHRLLRTGDLGQEVHLGTEGVEPEWRVLLLMPGFVIWLHPLDVVRR
jgi:hypothetical protein